MSVKTETASAFDFNETFADGEQSFPAVFQDAEFARLDRGQKRNVFWINAELAFRSREASPYRRPPSKPLPRALRFQAQRGHGD